ncbi:MAG: hypothetical protein JNK29_10290 [Anaerolineales bacterium]|nr:hypothetical protein [Anaerolineales bacterium]
MSPASLFRHRTAAWRGLLWLLAAGLWAAAAPRSLAADLPTLTITAASAFLREAPSTQAPATYSVFQGDVFPVTGRTADNTWLRVEYPKATRGTWILATLGQLAGSLADVPIVQPEGAGPAVTAPPASASPAAPPTPTPTPASTAPSQVCLLFYDDANGDGLAGPNEAGIAGGQLTLQAGDSGAVLLTYITTPGDAGRHCFTELAAGLYTFSVGAPVGYNATTSTSIQLRVQAGERHELTFGAQPGAAAHPVAGGLRLSAGWWWGLGLGMLLLAAGLAAFVLARRR